MGNIGQKLLKICFMDGSWDKCIVKKKKIKLNKQECRRIDGIF